MKKSMVFSKKGNYWFYHPIGVGVIFTYIPSANQVITTCSYTGQVIEVKNYEEHERFETEKEFIDAAHFVYLSMINDGMTISLDYMDDPEIVGCVGVDFDLLKN
jgi:hypothetical protein